MGKRELKYGKIQEVLLDGIWIIISRCLLPCPAIFLNYFLYHPKPVLNALSPYPWSSCPGR